MLAEEPSELADAASEIIADVLYDLLEEAKPLLKMWWKELALPAIHAKRAEVAESWRARRQGDATQAPPVIQAVPKDTSPDVMPHTSTAESG